MDIGKITDLYKNSEALEKPLQQIFTGQLENKKNEYHREYFLKISQKLNLKMQVSMKGTCIESQGIILHPNGSPFQVHPSYVYLVSELLNEKEIGKYGKVTYTRNKNILTYRVYLKIKQHDTLTPEQIETFNRVNTGYCLKFHDVLARLGLLKKINCDRAAMVSATLKLLQSAYSVLNGHLKSKAGLPYCAKKPQKHYTIQNEQILGEQEEGSSEKCCVIQRCHKITQCEEESSENKVGKKAGGYFSVSIKKCLIEGIRGQKQEQILAIKGINTEKKDSFEKIQRQHRILKKIRDSKYFLTYYQPELPASHPSQDKEPKIYMEYCEKTLNQEIYSTRTKFNTILDLSNQLLQGVSVLHQSGIVHRDLKPQNFLIAHSPKDKKKKFLKIIDFGQSSFSDADFQNSGEVLGYTLPYSPIQCMVLQKDGYNKEEIDIWSIGVLLYQMLFKTNPLPTSKCFVADIYTGWSIDGQFQPFLAYGKKHGIRTIQNIVSLICYFCLQIKQNHRIHLKQIQQIYKFIPQFFQTLS